MSSLSGRAGAAPEAADPRFKASRRDEAIRSRVEADLLRKRTAAGSPVPASPGRSSPGRSSPRRHRRRASGRRPSSALGTADGHAITGTVSSLRPLPALTVPQSISVADACQLCAAKRTDCVLVVDDDEHLAGIFTAKDLAFRVVAAGWDPRLTPVSAIMTRNPVVTRDSTSATETLNLMVTRGFRHLPVCNDEGDIIGLLDIAHVFYGALVKLERAHDSSQKLYAALEGVQNEWDGGSAQQNQMLEYIEALRERLALPNLASVLDVQTVPVTVNVRTTVREAARLMKQHRVTAVCVMDSSTVSFQSRGATSGKIAGIFTSKDVVLRVIAAGIDPRTCSVVRVMTPHPDTALPTLSIQDALRKMHDGRYLNLPVVEDNQLLGVVDVLRLTWKTLEQINSMNDEAYLDVDGSISMSNDGDAAGPMWDRFWNSFAHHEGELAEADPDEADARSLSASGISTSLSRRDTLNRTPSKIPRPRSQQSGSVTYRSSPQNGNLVRSMAGASLENAPRSSSEGPVNDVASDLFPSDSNSASGVRRRSLGPRELLTRSGVAALDPVAAVAASSGLTPAGETFQFKFTTPGRRAHRFAAPPNNFKLLHKMIAEKLSADEFCRRDGMEDDQVPAPDDFTVAYEDDEGDEVVITTDDDLAEAVRMAREANVARVMLILQGGPSWNTDLAASRAVRSRRRDSLMKDATLAAVAEEDEAKRSSSPAPSRSDSLIASGVRHRSESITTTSTRSRWSKKIPADLKEEGEKSDSDTSSVELQHRHRRSQKGSRRHRATPKHVNGDGLLLGFLSRDMALPAAIGFFGLSIIVAVTVCRPR